MGGVHATKSEPHYVPSNRRISGLYVWGLGPPAFHLATRTTRNMQKHKAYVVTASQTSNVALNS